MNLRIAILALIAISAHAAPMLNPDGVNLPPNDPGLNVIVYAIPGSAWLVGWNDNPTPEEFDFNDFMYTILFTTGRGTATFLGAKSALYNRAFLTNGMREIARDEPLEFLVDENAAVDFTLLTGSGYRFDSANRDTHIWAARTDQEDQVVTPEPSSICMVESMLFVLTLLRFVTVRR